MSSRDLWRLFLLLAGLVYVGGVLAANYQSPAFAIFFVVLAMTEVIGARRERH